MTADKDMKVYEGCTGGRCLNDDYLIVRASRVCWGILEGSFLYSTNISSL